MMRDDERMTSWKKEDVIDDNARWLTSNNEYIDKEYIERHDVCSSTTRRMFHL
jgi:hypothetical protein